MNGQTCVITGAASGIGRATALALGKRGVRLVRLGRNESAGQDVVRRVRTDGDGVSRGVGVWRLSGLRPLSSVI